MYQDALQRSGNTSQYAVNYMPAVDFHSSDTKASCAVLDPVFILPSGVPVHFIEGVRIKHLKRGQARDTDGIDLFAEAAESIANAAKDFSAEHSIFRPNTDRPHMMKQNGLPSETIILLHMICTLR